MAGSQEKKGGSRDWAFGRVTDHLADELLSGDLERVKLAMEAAQACANYGIGRWAGMGIRNKPTPVGPKGNSG